MADSLLLRLPRSSDQQAIWLALSADGAASPESGPLELAAARAVGREVIVLAPGADVLLTHAELPPARSSTKLQQLVPYALEEQLAEDIDTLHFAIGRRTGASTPVAVVARKRMEEWLALLGEHQIAPTALYADSELLPSNPAQAVVLLEGDSVTVRTPAGTVLTLSAEALSEALELGVEHTQAATGAAAGVILYTGAAEWQRHGAEVEAMRERFEGIQVQLLNGDPLQLFAAQLPSSSAIDLLQGPYAPARGQNGGWRAWRVALILLACLVALHVIGKGAELLVLHQRDAKLNAAITQVFRRAMPGEQDDFEARRRMEQRLAEVRNGENSNGLLDALGAFAKARSGTSGTQLEAVSFRSGVLELKLSAPDVESLNRLTQALGREGWQAHLVSGNPSHSGFEGSICMSHGS